MLVEREALATEIRSEIAPRMVGRNRMAKIVIVRRQAEMSRSTGVGEESWSELPHDYIQHTTYIVTFQTVLCKLVD